MKADLETLIRPNILKLVPYSSARDEFSGGDYIFLDANENPYDTGFNRYPDPYQRELKDLLSRIRKIPADRIFAGNGSDEAIDLLIRACCEPGKDAIMQLTPTYGMYKVCADIHNVETINVPLIPESFQIDVEQVISQCTDQVKLIFLCSPNNPTGNLLGTTEILQLAERSGKLVVVDEAYHDFTDTESLSAYIGTHPNLVILQTLSKAWGLAGIRLGLMLADRELIRIMNRIKYPYNVNQLTIDKALEVLNDPDSVRERCDIIISERKRLAKEMADIPSVLHLYPSDANFLLAKVKDARMVYEKLIDRGVVVRDRSRVPGLDGCLRFTVGTPEENDTLLKSLKEL